MRRPHRKQHKRVQAEPRIKNIREIESLNLRLQQMNEALTLSNIRQHELMETADILNARLHRAIQESHHRIKNNLQVVCSLVEMQMGEIGATESDARLRRINQHIRSLVNIHDLLTQQVKVKAEAETLGTRPMLQRLIAMLRETSGGSPIKSHIADFQLPTQQAASLSLLVSECVSNAVKHGKGEIGITLSVEENQARLEVCDEGSGFSPDFDWHTVAHTGLSLIDATGRYDLRGDVRFDNHARGGGRVTVTFPIREPLATIK